MKAPLAITACETLTPLGFDTWAAVCRGERVEKQNAVDDALLDPNLDLDRSIRLGLSVARRAVRGAQPEVPLALFCGTSKGPVGIMLAALERMRHHSLPTEAQARHIALGTGAMGPVIADMLHRESHLTFSQLHTSVAACSSGMHALHRAAKALWRHECTRALVVAADASLHPLFEASFKRLGVLSPADERGIRRCRPFDPAGEGFFLSEAAAAIVLETADSLSESHPLAWLVDSWIGTDGTNLIAIDPATDTLRLGLSTCLKSQQRCGQPPAFIHAHATGTAHDACEREAILAVVPAVPLFSHKAWLGHSLGAAGLVSAALTVQCHRHNETLEGDLVPGNAASLTIAQGFGGHVAVVAMRGAGD